MSFTYSMMPVDVVSVKRLSNSAAQVVIVPRGKATESKFVKGVLETFDVKNKPQIAIVKNGKFGWYAEAPWKRRNEDTGKVFYTVRFMDVRERMRSAHVLAGVSAMIAHSVFGADYKKGAPKLHDSAGCHNCWNMVRGSEAGEALDFIDDDGIQIQIPFTIDQSGKNRYVNNFCQTLGEQILLDFDKEMDHLQITNGDRYGNLHDFKDKFEYGGKLLDRKRIFETFAMSQAHGSNCNGCHIWSLPDSKYPNKWINETPKASQAHLSSEETEFNGQLYKLPVFQIGGISIRMRWLDFMKEGN